jgi:hypothetical protein
MRHEHPSYWFPVKTYGWGWGLPVRWQGWVVVLGYFALFFLGLRYFRGQRDVRGLIAYVLVLTVLLIVVVIAKGERPARWRWGKN